MKKFTTIIFLLCLLLIGCGNIKKKFARHAGPGTTEVRIGTKKNGLGIFNTLSGGIMIYAQMSGLYNYSGSAYVSSEDDVLIWTLPNGNYRFFAFGYTGNISAASSTVMCADGGDVALTGLTTVVNLNFTHAACSNANLFQPTASDSGSASQPYDMLMVGCDPSSGDLGLVTTAGGNNVCDGAGGRPSSATAVQSYEFSIPEYDNFDGDINVYESGDAIYTGCLDFPDTYTGGSHHTTNIKLLPGGPNSPFLYGFNFFSANGCTGDKSLIGFTSGLFNTANSELKFFFTPNAGTESEVGPGASTMVKQISGASWNWFFFREI